MKVYDTEDIQGNMIFESIIKSDITIEYIEHMFKNMIREHFGYEYELISIRHVMICNDVSYFGESDIAIAFYLIGQGGTTFLFDTYIHVILQRIREEKLEKILKE